MTETERALKIKRDRDFLSVIDGLLGDCADAHRRHSASPEPVVSALRASVNYRNPGRAGVELNKRPASNS